MSTRTSRIMSLALSGVLLIAGLVGGGLVGRQVGASRTADASGAAHASASASSGASGASGTSVSTATLSGPSAVVAREGIGASAGPLVSNPSGAPDLTADPAAQITGTPRTASAPAPARFDEPLPPPVAPSAAPSGSASPASGPTPTTSPTGGTASNRPGAGPVDLSRIQLNPDVFTDPCLRTPKPSGCPQGLEGTVLGDRIPPELKMLWAGEVRRTDFYAGECARQYPATPIDWNQDSVFAAVVNVPVTGLLTLTMFRPDSTLHVSGVVGETPAGRVNPSGEIVDQWVRAFSSGARTPTVALCLRVPKATMDANRHGCLATWSGYWMDCLSRFEVTLGSGCDSSTTDPFCTQMERYTGFAVPRRVLGPVVFTYSYDPQWSFSESVIGDAHLTGDDLRRRVELYGVDPLNLEVRVPTLSRSMAEADLEGAPSPDGWAPRRPALTENQLVAVAGYAPGTDCRAADPTTVSTVLPVTRQGSRTRYVTPDPGKPVMRDAIVNLTMPQLAPGEAVAICVYWYQLANHSYDNPTVTAIERHLVVPPSRSGTEISVVEYSDRVGPVNPDRWTWQWIGERGLTQSCGFDSMGRAPTLRPLGRPGLLCVISSSRFVFDPADLELYASNNPGSGEGRIRLPINNRGCDGDCGFGGIHRLNLSDGTWLELSVRQAPLSTTPMLPGGQIRGGAFDRWTIDPEAPVSVAPSIRLPVATPFPQLDLMSLRVAPDPADPQHGLAVTWQANREVTVAVQAYAVSDLRYSSCRDTWSGSSAPANHGVTSVVGLCPGTNYQVVVAATDPATQRTTSYAIPASPPTETRRMVAWNGQARTSGPAIPDEYVYEWSLSIDRPGRVPQAVIVSGIAARLGDRLTTGASAGSCQPLAAVRASGQAHPTALGELEAGADLSLALYEDAQCAGTPQLVQVRSSQTVHWLGAEPASFVLPSSEGWQTTLSVRRAT